MMSVKKAQTGSARAWKLPENKRLLLACICSTKPAQNECQFHLPQTLRGRVGRRIMFCFDFEVDEKQVT
jgi:hypothetical protein